MCLALLVACFGCEKEATTFKIDGETGVSGAVALADNHIQSLVSSMQVLAMTDEIRTGSWEGMSGLLSRLEQDQIPAAVWFALPDGSYYTVDQGKAAGNLSDRSYFPKVMSGATAIGDLVVSKSTGKKVVIATVPVKNNGQVIGALGASVYLDDLSKILVSELELPDNMVLYAVNEQGNITLHSDSQWIMQKAADLGSKTFADAIEEMLLKKEGNVNYEFQGMSENVVFKTSPLTGWSFALGLRSK